MDRITVHGDANYYADELLAISPDMRDELLDVQFLPDGSFVEIEAPKYVSRLLASGLAWLELPAGHPSGSVEHPISTHFSGGFSAFSVRPSGVFAQFPSSNSGIINRLMNGDPFL